MVTFLKMSARVPPSMEGQTVTHPYRVSLVSPDRNPRLKIRELNKANRFLKTNAAPAGTSKKTTRYIPHNGQR